MRIEATFFGQVQGIGFRYTAFRIATAQHVNGYVVNRPDGSVFLVLEGSSASVESALAAIQSHFGGYITEGRYNTDCIPEGLGNFEIRHHG